MYVDSLRIPEIIELYEGMARTALIPADKQHWLSEAEKHRKRLQPVLESYEMGEIDLDTYTRLTTVQNYTHEHLWELRDEVKTFIPSHVGTNMYSLRLGGKNTNEYGISLKVENGVLVKDGEYGTPPKVIPMPKAVNDGF